MKKRIMLMMVFSIVGLTIILGGTPINKVCEASGATEMRGVWIAYVDFYKLGLKNKSEATFRKNAGVFLDKAKKNNVNTVFFHVRAFDDAVYKSKTFDMSEDIWSLNSKIPYDPLDVMVELTHKKDMAIHGWMNPYRITTNYYLDPAKTATNNRIVTAAKEVMAHKVDGIHFDDYFYHAGKGYKDVNGKVTIYKSKEPSSGKKKAYVNKMVSSVYKNVNAIKPSVKFGISPQGNIENCRNSGGDIDKWMSKTGYIDYIIPQIYWTDQWGSSGKITMFSDRLKAWQKLNKRKMPIYIGLALYRTATKYSDDIGWKAKNTNLYSQLKLLRGAGCKGFVLFSGQDLNRSSAQRELEYLNYGITGQPVKTSMKTSYVNSKAIRLKWNKVSGAKGYQIWRATREKGKYAMVKTITPNTMLTYTNTNLTPGKRYYYKVRTYNKSSSGKIRYGNYSSVKYRSAVPQESKLSLATGYKKIKVKWSRVPYASGYVIYRATSKNGTYKMEKTVDSGSATEYLNTGLTKGTRYYYKIRAFEKEKGKRIYGPYSDYASMVSK
ncbi:MAG: family 10 glycosylhydrolase [Anaerovoracaceae bacterium]